MRKDNARSNSFFSLFLEYCPSKIRYAISFAILCVEDFVKDYIHAVFMQSVTAYMLAYNWQGALQSAAMYFASIVVVLALTSIFRMAFVFANNGLECALKRAIAQHYVDMSVEAASDVQTGLLLELTNRDVNRCTMAFKQLYLDIASSVLYGMGGFVVICRVSPLLACFAAAAGTVSSLLIRKYKTEQSAVSESMAQRNTQLTQYLHDHIAGIPTIKRLLAEETFIEKYDAVSSDALREENKNTSIGIRIKLIQSLGRVVIQGGTLAVGMLLAIRGKITIPDVMFCMGMAYSVHYSINSIFGINVVAFEDARVGAGRIRAFLARDRIAPEVPGHLRAIQDVPALLCVDDLSYALPGQEKEMLSHCSFTLGKHQMMAVAGPSGCGKSTLLKLIAGIYDGYTGSILLSDDEKCNGSVLWQAHIAYIDQNSLFFHRSIGENICYGRDIDEQKLRLASERAMIYETIMRLPEKFSTNMSNMGKQFSEGQMQRISIARGLYDMETISLLLLDEVTSHLDQRNRDAFLATLKKLSRHKTLIFVTHDEAIMKAADTVLFMEAGQIVAEGPYEDLLRNPAFLRFVTSIQEAEVS